jgi:hypothetical protein
LAALSFARAGSVATALMPPISSTGLLHHQQIVGIGGERGFGRDRLVAFDPGKAVDSRRRG